MFRDAFVKPDKLEIEALLQEINPKLDGSPFDARSATILAMALSFYPGYRLLDIADHGTVPARRVSILYAPGNIIVLDWTNGPLYALNKTGLLQIDDSNVIEYVRFFYAFVRGRHGRFLITESADDIVWKEEPTPAARKAISRLVEPLRLVGTSPLGDYVLSARIIFKDSLFKATISVSPQGGVTMSEEELVIEDMPVQDDVLVQHA